MSLNKMKGREQEGEREREISISQFDVIRIKCEKKRKAHSLSIGCWLFDKGRDILHNSFPFVTISHAGRLVIDSN